MKKNNIFEVIEMLRKNNTLKFKIKNDETSGDMIYVDKGYLVFKHDMNFEHKYAQNFCIDCNLEFELIEESFTFDEILKGNIDKSCYRFEHKLLEDRFKEDFDCGESFINSYWEHLKNGEYIAFTGILLCLGWIFNYKEIKEVLKEGKWYAEP